MGRGFYHPEHGYFQTTSEISDGVEVPVLTDAVEIPLKPGPEFDWNGQAWLERPAPEPTAQQIKAEANRRILAIVPDWKQRNLTAQAAQLAEKGRANWTADELAAWDAGLAIWAQVKAIRDASDVIEALSPRPANYVDDAYWL